MVSLRPGSMRYTAKHMGSIVKIGFPSCAQYLLTMVAVGALMKFMSAYDTDAVAALGIVKKLDMLPLYFSIGVSGGILPLLPITTLPATGSGGIRYLSWATAYRLFFRWRVC